jgi:hypothetical protein
LIPAAIAKIDGMPPSSEDARGNLSLWSHYNVDDDQRLPADSNRLPATFCRCEWYPLTQNDVNSSSALPGGEITQYS